MVLLDVNQSQFLSYCVTANKMSLFLHSGRTVCFIIIDELQTIVKVKGNLISSRYKLRGYTFFQTATKISHPCTLRRLSDSWYIFLGGYVVQQLSHNLLPTLSGVELTCNIDMMEEWEAECSAKV